MTKFRQPKRVTIPNCRTFLSRYARKSKTNPLTTATIKTRYKTWRQRRYHRGTGFGSLGRKAFGFLKTFARSNIGKSLGGKALEYTSQLYEQCVGKIKKKQGKVLLSSELPRAGTSYGARFLNKKVAN